jgi:hypothetical protein
VPVGVPCLGPCVIGRSLQVFPPPGFGWAAIGLAAETKPMLTALFSTEELEHPRRRQPMYQCGSLLRQTRRPQPAQQFGHASRVSECSVGCGPPGQRGNLLLQTRCLEYTQQLGHAPRVVEGDVGGWITVQQRGRLIRQACLPQTGQQLRRPGGAVQGDVGGGTSR